MKKLALVAAAIGMSFSSAQVIAKVTDAEAAKLGNELTIMGAEKGANADGSIPAWTGGITAPPAGYSEGDHHVDPYVDDVPLYTITAANYKEYDSLLSDGQKKLFETYPDTYKMPVYPTRRSASYPQFVLDATKANATRAELVDGGNGVNNAAIGVPFPIPANGLEAIWNHILRFRGEAVQRFGGQAAVTASGDYVLYGFDDVMLMNYAQQDATPESLADENMILKFKQKTTSPASARGAILLVHETLNQVKESRVAWSYAKGQPRPIRVPNISYDAPGTNADGLRTTDDFDMFNGAPDRYTWELKGKQELLIAYNSYKLHSDSLTYDEILQPGHINPDVTRYEKHRVWVVEANLKPEFRHEYHKRVFYIDEDSWQIHVADLYDSQGELYRVVQAYGLNYYEVPTAWTTLEVYHDLNSRRYLALGLDNETRMYDFSVRLNEKEFTGRALRKDVLN